MVPGITGPVIVPAIICRPEKTSWLSGMNLLRNAPKGFPCTTMEVLIRTIS